MKIKILLITLLIEYSCLSSINIEKCYKKDLLSKHKKWYPWFKIKTLDTILKHNKTVCIQKYLENIFYMYEPFPPSSLYPHQDFCSDCFILTIPYGKAQGMRGDIFIDNFYIKDFAYKGLWQLLIGSSQPSDLKIKKIPGRVAVIAQDLANYYFHWIQDVLGRLALLEMHGIEYDFLYAPYHKKFMKETLDLWGIESNKIISPSSFKFCVQAQELIVPSFVLNKNHDPIKYAGFHINPVTMQYVSEKLTNAAKRKNIDTVKFSKRIFISRKDAKDNRRILNEDEIFALFEAKGFVRYELATLSVVEQIMLFHQAEIVAGEHGAGLTNCLFCKPGVKVIEIFQELIDSSFWWIAQVMNLNYQCVQAVEVNADYFAYYGLRPKRYRAAWKKQQEVSLKGIEELVEKIESR